ncbi:MAG: helicase [Mesorhizobium sp.]|uniref:helicase n=1 Tax=Mesorhizobium sp. TaxID=1871066 RepID=UPI00120268DE|nr:helicase [Mesorhizobium sp.]TIL91436.1 MAG: helicase [Mesorhizobium sp.]
MTNYENFLARKAIIDPPTGLDDIPVLPDVLFPFQRDIVRWALKRGRAALFAGTGLGKSLMELSWAQTVNRATGKDVLHLAPLAVSNQMAREADKFGITARVVRSQEDCGAGTNITNYQKLEHFDLSQFGGVILDESSILKSTTGHYRNELIKACKDIPFRLAATATPAPNDFMELGNHAEFLGIMSYTDMLATFFAHDNGDTQKWRLKGHAENDFWKWMASWSVMMRKPSDIGYDDGAYILPPLEQIHHVVRSSASHEGLFRDGVATLQQRIAARRDTVTDRVAHAVSLTPTDRPFVWWCNLNAESEALAKAIPDAVEIRGSDKNAERKLIDFSEGRIRVLVTKPSICGFGMNWQHCADTGFVGLNDSFEQVYQAVRRFWRFGQSKPVMAHFIAADTEGAVVANLKRKESDADRMAAAMILHTADISTRNVRGQVRDKPNYDPKQPMKIPSWLGVAA